MIGSMQARTIANCIWGQVHNTKRTNRTGAFWFDCAGHGGYIISADILDEKEYKDVSRFLTPEIIYVSRDNYGVIRRMHHDYKKSRTRTPFNPFEKEEIFIAEEDNDWAVIQTYTRIRLKCYSDREKQLREYADRTLRGYIPREVC